MRRKLRSKASGSRAWKTRKPIWIVGKMRWADTRIHGTTKRQVAAMFAEERPALLPLPVEPFRYYQYGERAVHLDGCVEVEAAYYGAPPGWIGRRVQVQWNAAHVRLLNRSPVNCCASTYAKSAAVIESKMKIVRGGRHYRRNSCCTAPRKSESTLVSCARRMHRKHGELAVRRILGVLALAKKYGIASTDDTCALALETSTCEYHFVRRYLEHNPQLPLSLRQVDPLIRQLTLYRDLIESRTRQEDQS